MKTRLIYILAAAWILWAHRYGNEIPLPGWWEVLDGYPSYESCNEERLKQVNTAVNSSLAKRLGLEKMGESGYSTLVQHGNEIQLTYYFYHCFPSDFTPPKD